MHWSTLPLTILCLGSSSLAAPPGSTVLLDDLIPGANRQSWGSLKIGESVTNRPLSIGGRTFTTGLGTHAPSEVSYPLGRNFESFHAWVGIDDDLTPLHEAQKASVRFLVYGDGRLLFDSGVMKYKDRAKEVAVSLSGIEELKLVASDAGDGMNSDHANWADAKLVRGPLLSPGKECTLSSFPTPSSPTISMSLSTEGGIRVTGSNGESWVEAAGTRLEGFQHRETTDLESLPGGALSLQRTLKDQGGRSCVVTDRFSPTPGAIRWDIEISGDAPTWTTPVQSQFEFHDSTNKFIWTAWGTPDDGGTQLGEAKAALVQAGKLSTTGVWNDPLQSAPFSNRFWHYGNISQNCPIGADFTALPTLAVLNPTSNQGLSIVLSPEDVLLDIKLVVSRSGQVCFTRSKHRLGGGRPLRFTLYLVPHEASWRGPLRFLTEQFPAFFDPPNPRADVIAACGAYSAGEEDIDVPKFKRMALGFNWKLSDDFPYMGMFIPPVASPDESWQRSCDETSAAYKGPLSSCRIMNDYARYMKHHGFSVLSYLNVTEFGKRMNGRNPQLDSNAPDLWKDPAGYLAVKLPNAALRPPLGTCYGARVVDPADPDYMQFLLEQGQRHLRMIPDSDGICIDRTDWLRYDNTHADDDVTWVGNKPARSLFRSWLTLMDRMGPLMHDHDKVIFSNMMTMRLELCRQLDGIYTEFGNHGCALNTSSLLGLRKPVVAWTYNQTLNEPDPDSFMQRHLYMGCFPTAPYPHNNHCIEPSPEADKIYQEYGILLDLLRGKKWVLTPDAVSTLTPGVKTNLFKTGTSYLIPIVFGGDKPTAVIRIGGLPASERLTAAVFHPGSGNSLPIAFDAARPTLNVPLQRGCALVRLTPLP